MKLILSDNNLSIIILYHGKISILLKLGNDKIIYGRQTVMHNVRFNSKINVASSDDASIEIFAKT